MDLGGAEYVSLLDAAAQLGVSLTRARELVRLGQLPLLRLGLTVEAVPVSAIALLVALLVDEASQAG